jgi:hypothetical protein
VGAATRPDRGLTPLGKLIRDHLNQGKE